MSATPFKFDMPVHHKSIIKVIGVGGGGSNAVNHMYNQGIKDVEFVVCNTDIQALKISPVPTRIQLGSGVLGAGGNPEKGRSAALESKEEIRELLSDGTKMVFITAGMGGGTGTGAAPVIAKISKELDILTVGIVTLPFRFEGKRKLDSAKAGITELKQHCDTVLVIVNDKLFEITRSNKISEAWKLADNVLTTAAKSIAEIITVTSHVNVDFEDVKTVMQNSGAAVMGSAIVTGEDRAIRAAEEAICSPLLDSTDILGAKKILLSLASGDEAELTIEELDQITKYIEEKAGQDAEMIWGQGVDNELGDGIRVTIIATGFDHGYEKEKSELPNKTVFHLERDSRPEEREAVKNESKDVFVYQKPQDGKPAVETVPNSYIFPDSFKEVRPSEPVHHSESAPAYTNNYVPPVNNGQLDREEIREEPKEENISQGTFPFVNDIEDKKRILQQQAQERINKLKGLNTPLEPNPTEFKEKLDVPAYLRRNVPLPDYPHSSEKKISRLNINDDNEILGNNRFLHDNVD